MNFDKQIDDILFFAKHGHWTAINEILNVIYTSGSIDAKEEFLSQGEAVMHRTTKEEDACTTRTQVTH